MKTTKTRSALAGILFLSALVLGGCQANQTVLQSGRNGTPAPPMEPRKSTAETGVKDMETAGFEYVFVIRRKDGGVLDKDDKKFLRDSMPVEINRRETSDDEKSVILGSMYIVPKETIDIWKQRFVVEDRSKPAPAEKKPEANNNQA